MIELYFRPERLRELREERGFSRTEIAAAAGVTADAVSLWERGLAVPRADKLARVAALCGVILDELFGEAPASADDPA